jgi:hypothetical protein
MLPELLCVSVSLREPVALARTVADGDGDRASGWSIERLWLDSASESSVASSWAWETAQVPQRDAIINASVLRSIFMVRFSVDGDFRAARKIGSAVTVRS